MVDAFEPADWPEYISHKIVRAAPIVAIIPEGEPAVNLTSGLQGSVVVELPDQKRQRFVPSVPAMMAQAEIGGYAVYYPGSDNDWRSISPKLAFDEGYKPYPGPYVGKERPRNSILMSRDNPEGWKLEDLLKQLREELDRKNDRLGGDQHPVAKGIIAANRKIISQLAQAEMHQRASLGYLDALGPDQGPRGTPRVGPGSASDPAPGLGPNPGEA